MSIFLETYNKLDELCKRQTSSDNGISAYVNKMEQFPAAYTVNIVGWNEDYKKLQYLLRMNANLANGICTDEDFNSQADVIWMENFMRRLEKGQDPLSYSDSILKDKKAKQNKILIIFAGVFATFAAFDFIIGILIVFLINAF